METNIQKTTYVCNFNNTNYNPRFLAHGMDAEFKKKHNIDTDQKMSRTYIDAFGSSQDMLKAIISISKRARAVHKSFVVCSVGSSTQYADDLIPVTLMANHSKAMEELRQEYFGRVTDFLDNYVQLKDNAIAEFNGAVDGFYYPSLEEVQNKFSWSFKKNALPDANAFDQKLGNLELEQEMRDDVSSKYKELISIAVLNVVDRLKIDIQKIKSQASGDKAVNEATLNNFASFLTMLPDLNISGCPKIAKAYEDAKQLLKHSPSATADQSIKDVLIEKTTSILNDLDAINYNK